MTRERRTTSIAGRSLPKDLRAKTAMLGDAIGKK
jgi:hypothetical protein